MKSFDLMGKAVIAIKQGKISQVPNDSLRSYFHRRALRTGVP